jgi:hypothetical protein
MGVMERFEEISKVKTDVLVLLIVGEIVFVTAQGLSNTTLIQTQILFRSSNKFLILVRNSVRQSSCCFRGSQGLSSIELLDGVSNSLSYSSQDIHI